MEYKKYRAGKGKLELFSSTLSEARVNAKNIAKNKGDGEYVSIFEHIPHHEDGYVPMACER